jgi:hypothetical protein
MALRAVGSESIAGQVLERLLLFSTGMAQVYF